MKIVNCLRLFCWIVGLLLCCNHLKASHYYFKQISLKEGLPSTVRCIYAEKKGFVWIGTRSGLGRFDGHELKRYTYQSDNPNSLPHNHIHQIVEDSLHNIWIMTDKGIARYRRRSDDFDDFDMDEDKHLAPSSGNKVTPMRQPAARRGVNMEVCVVKPTSVDDSREITETLLAGRTVILNLEGMDLEIAQRIIDFTSGSAFAIDGNLQKISSYIFLVTPANVDISGDMQDLLNTSFDVPIQNRY